MIDVRRVHGLAAAILALVAGAALEASPASAAYTDFGIAKATASLSSSEAGGHPDFTTLIEVTTDPSSAPDVKGRLRPEAELKDVEVELPPGLVGNPNAVLTCSILQFAESEFEVPGRAAGCPHDSQVGVVILERYGSERTIITPLFNLEAPGGDVVARLGTGIFSAKVFVDVGVRSDGDYGISARAEGISSLGKIISLKTVLWAVPAAESHDTERLTLLESSQGASSSPPRPSGLAPRPFLTNPTRCGVPLSVGFSATSYQLPDQVSTAAAALPEMTDCGQIDFAPSLSMKPTATATASPSGLEATLTIPQNETVDGVATSQLRRARVSLPAGFSLAPGAADGLGACSVEQVRLHDSPPVAAACPDDSKIGSLEFDSPALSRTIRGGIYQRAPEAGNLFRIWLVSDELGVHVKLPGQIQADPASGQLTALFDGPPAAEGNPQLPLEGVTLSFKAGSRGVLATPASCGAFDASFEFEPWSGNQPATGAVPMTIAEVCDGGGFGPRLSAGAVDPMAGEFSPFVAEIVRTSDEENLAGLDLTLPRGALAKLAGVPLCEGAAAASGDCPPASRIGTTAVAVGPGPTPLWIPQPGKAATAVYLGASYEGAPYSLVVKTPAQAGPFDLGTVVVRAAVRVDPVTAQVSVESDRLPQILEGVPISYRTIHVDVDRPEFTVNPTNCSPQRVTGAATSPSGRVAQLDDSFQVDACEALDFDPRLRLRLRGATGRGGNPALTATVSFPRGAQANVARASVALPSSQFLDQAHIRTVCTRPQLAADQCPRGSVYGYARAVTPLLDQPLEGPVYMGTGYGHDLPDLVADLEGPIRILLRGRIDTDARGGIRATFEALPDAPVRKFTLSMRGGQKGLLQNSQNICASPQRATARLTAQNGRRSRQRPLVRAACGRAKAGSLRRR